MSEWLKETDCKSVRYAYAGSNPARPTTKHFVINFGYPVLLYGHQIFAIDNRLVSPQRVKWY